MEALLIEYLDLVEQQILLTTPIMGQTPLARTILRIWLVWALKEGFLHIFTPFIAVLWRPIRLEDLPRIQDHYFETRFEFNRSGDTLLIDYCYAPGHVPFVIGLIKAGPYPYTAWQNARTEKIRLIETKRLKTLGRHPPAPGPGEVKNVISVQEGNKRRPQLFAG